MSSLSHPFTGIDMIAHLQEQWLLLGLAGREEGPVLESSLMMLAEVEATSSDESSAGKKKKPEGPK